MINQSCQDLPLSISHITHMTMLGLFCGKIHDLFSRNVRCLCACFSFIFYDCFTLLPSDTTHRNESCHAYKEVMSHVSISLVTRMNISCRTYEWVVSHIWMSRVFLDWVMVHLCMSHVTHMNESCHTYAWVMSHTWIRPVINMNVFHKWVWVM